MSHNVVIISAHPDDMEIGMGGTVAKLVESMAVITSVVITNGGRSSNPFALTEQRMADIRRGEALRAAGILGVKEVIFCDEPDAAEEINTMSVARRLVEILARLRPTEVYTLDEELDRHPAHRLAGKLARESVLEAGIVLSGGIWAYEIWGLFATWDRLEYIDRYVAKKMAAIAEHHSQVATIPYGEGVLGLNRWRAVFADPKASAPVGVYAEVFRRVTISPRSPFYIRGEFYREKAKDYVGAAIATGVSEPGIMFRHILPNALTPVVSFAPFEIVGNISALVALDFLGFGLPAPTPSWGELIGQGMENLTKWWLVFYPLGVLFLTLLLVVFIGEAVREAFDPKEFSRLR